MSQKENSIKFALTFSNQYLVPKAHCVLTRSQTERLMYNRQHQDQEEATPILEAVYLKFQTDFRSVQLWQCDSSFTHPLPSLLLAQAKDRSLLSTPTSPFPDGMLVPASLAERKKPWTSLNLFHCINHVSRPSHRYKRESPRETSLGWFFYCDQIAVREISPRKTEMLFFRHFPMGFFLRSGRF